MLSVCVQFIRYSLPRRWITVLVVIVLGFLIVGIPVSIKKGVLLYIFAATFETKQSSRELEAIIPYNSLKNRASLLNISNDLIPPHEESIQCLASDPKVLFFMRIPKCASTSFVDVLSSLAKSSAFELFFHPSGAYDWDTRTTRKVANFAMSKKQRFVYARHFYYVDFHPFELRDYTYLTIIREPVSRFVSSYLYYHFSSKSHIQRMLDPNHRNETLIECTEHQHDGCAHNWLTKYFCGHERFCKLGNDYALSVAKKNLRKDFSIVGVLEEMDLSLKLISHLLPGYFSALSTELPGSNKNERSMELSDRELNAVEQANQADIELYRYALQLLHNKANKCKLTD